VAFAYQNGYYFVLGFFENGLQGNGLSKVSSALALNDEEKFCQSDVCLKCFWQK
jgi:hypothetical protein